MRLGTCIAGELAAGIAMATGIYFAAGWGVDAAKRMRSSEAQAASLTVQDVQWTPIERVRPFSAIEGAVRPAPVRAGQPGDSVFFGVPDAQLLAPLRGASLDRLKFNRGGSGVSFRADFVGGGRGSFKPDQINLQSEPRHEIAAYRIDRLLGIGAVAPAIPVRFRVDELYDRLDRRYANSVGRIRAEVITRDGWVRGGVSWWIPEIDHARVGGFPIDSFEGKVAWKRLLTVGNDIPEADREMARQISTMVLFDHLINNMDRWTGNNTRSSPDNRQLYFMDNALAFGGKSIGADTVIVFLRRSQKFSRSLVGRIRALRAEDVERVMAADLGPYERLLDDSEIRALMKRRDYQMGYIDELIAEHGEDAVLVFP